MAEVLFRGVTVTPGARPNALIAGSGRFLANTRAGETLSYRSVGRDATVEATRSIDTKDDQHRLCEVELEDGVLLWMRAEDLPTSGLFHERRDRGDGAIVLDPVSPSERGAYSSMVKALRFFGVDPGAFVANATRTTVVTRIEDIDREHGLYIIGPESEPDFRPANLKPGGASNAPYLLMLHGTASSVSGSFGNLWQEGDGRRMAALREFYGDGRMLGFEHRTLSESPIENVLQLVKALPAGARLHLLSHSRGGLVGELLARGSADATGLSSVEVDRYRRVVQAGGIDANARPADDEVDKLQELVRRLAEKKLQVERFVRVACPARGTTIASGNLQRWLSIALNVIGYGVKPLVNTLAPVYKVPLAMTGDLLKAVMLDLADLDVLPGLRAQNPASPFIRALINAPGAATRERLTVISGDAEGTGILGRLKMLAIDAFFSRDNDLVVDTPSMTGGATRVQPAYRYLQKGSGINHFGYFSHEITANRVIDGLTVDSVQLKGFEGLVTDQQPLRPAPIDATPRSRSGLSRPPIVYVVPGIMGSYLTDRGNRVWIDKPELILGGFSKLSVNGPPLDVEVIDGDTYRSLVDYLATSHEVNPFPYDWRGSIEDAGRRLNEALTEKLKSIDTTKQPIRIVAHSMGGLVLRAMMLRSDSAWPEIIRHPGARALMLGTPNEGSHAISLILTGQEKLLRSLAWLDLTHSLEDIVEIAAAFQGALDMLPSRSDRDYYDRAVWADLLQNIDRDWPLPSEAALKKARDFRDKLDQQVLDRDRIFYVAGKNDQTPIGIQVESKPGSTPRLKFMATAQGDGRVPWDGGIPAGVSCWYVPAVHGDIPNFKAGHAGFGEILERGATNLLSHSPPTIRGSAVPFELRQEPPGYLPEQGDLIRAAMGSRALATSAERPPLASISVQVVWGDLQRALYPVVVGHYAGDSILSAEAALDRAVNGALSARNAIDRYPGAVGTSIAISLADHAKSSVQGAVVVGLGFVGNGLASGDIATAVQAGVLEWAASYLEVHSAIPDRGNGLSFILIGTGAGGTGTRESCSAILSGVKDGLARLSDLQRETLQLTNLEIIEVYEDRVHSAWRAVNELLGDSGYEALKRQFALTKGGIRTAAGGRRRLMIDDVGEWWQPLKITMTGDQFLYENVTERARAELRSVDFHLSQVRKLVAASIATTHRDPELEIALFEMLLPNELKDFAPRLDKLRLVLDINTAGYPWEMLVDRGHRRGQGASNGLPDDPPLPQAVKAGMIRQLVLPDFRPQPTVTEGVDALIIANPVSSMVDLPGATSEGVEVAARLKLHRFKPVSLINSDAQSIIRAIFTRGYRVIHFAGHGTDAVPSEYFSKDAAEGREQNHSGMIIGDDEYLTSRNVEQMRDVPEVVFINCCHLGAFSPWGEEGEAFRGQNRMAAGFGEQFVRIGVKVVIAAGWAVEDAAASLFASTFYDRMLAGAEFGQAVIDARLATFVQFPNSNTWAAYQCYGDPSFRLQREGRKSGLDLATAPYASAQHFAIEGIGATGTEDEVALMQTRAEELGFSDHSMVCVSLGDRYRDFGNLERAIGNLDRALVAVDGSIPLEVTESLVDLRIRLALASPASGGNAVSLDAIDAGLAHLGALYDLHPQRTSQWARLGVMRKRQVRLLTMPDRTSALGKMYACYARAQSQPMVEPLLHARVLVNAALEDASVAFSGKVSSKERARVDVLLAEARRLIDTAKTARSDDTEQVASEGLLMLMRALVTNKLSAGDQAILAQIAALRGRSPALDDFAETLKLLVTLGASPAYPVSMQKKWQKLAAGLA